MRGPAGTPVVVLVPGLGLDDREWTVVRRALTGDSAVVTLPSMGRRAPRGSDLTVERQAERLSDALPRDRDVVLVGHSASCPVVVEVAASRTCVAGLVLVGPVTDPRAATWPRMVSQWVRAARHERLGEVLVLAPQYRRTGPASMLRGMDAVRRYRTDRVLARLDVPVEVVRGEHDRISPQDWCSALRGGGPTRLTPVPGAGHMVPLTHPLVVSAAAERLRAGASTRPDP